MIRIIHISDFHLESETPSYEKGEIIKALIKDLSDFVEENTILSFTGDLVDKGGVKFAGKKTECFDSFQSLFLDKIVQNHPLLKNKIFIVPGNHDVFREKIDPVTEVGLKGILTTVRDVNSFLLSNRETSKHLDRISDYKHWEKRFYASYPQCNLSNFENTFILDLAGTKVGVTCLNSSWLCKDDTDKENLIVGKNQVENSLEMIKECDIKLALAHHPLEFLKEFDRESVKVELYKNYDVLFTGHVHELDSLYTQNLYGSIFISIANSTIADNPEERRFVNGYSIIDLYPNDKIVVQYRKYLEKYNSFVPNTDVGTSDGSKEYIILKNDSLKKFNTVTQVVEYIEEQHVEKLNEHLIMSSSYTNVSCTIDNLFVEPNILNYPEALLKEEDMIEYSIESIISQKSNFLIYGVKESGRTILLDMMFLEALKKVNQLDKVPVIIKFSDFKKKSIDKIIREFLGLSSADFKEFIQDNKLILFIDVLSFLEKNRDQITTLQRFVIEHPKVQIVATADQVLDNIFPTNYLQFNDIFHFELGFIQSLSSKQIKKFVSKWFAGKDIDLQDSMEKLVRNFADFGLPKTPLSVTLFLWIFEKQEKRPINNAVLVEIFIENLLEKTNIDNIYSETFDFKNKQRLLSFIAKYMNDNGNSDLNYCVDYVDLLTFVNSYLKTRFHGQPQKVLDDLLSRGVLSFEEDNLVRFKSAFFFHYFLALHFDYDLNFKEHVFTDDNYLDYIDEIIYYTGLKRDDQFVLKFTQDKLNIAFGEYQHDLKENHRRIDEVLEVKNASQAISFQIDENKIQNKPTEEQIEEVYDAQLSHIPVQKIFRKKIQLT